MIVVYVICICVVATLAQHLGLLPEIAKVISKIASCAMCSTFWACVSFLVFVKHVDIAIAATFSVLAAYMSHWVLLVLLWLQKVYNRVWERIK